MNRYEHKIVNKNDHNLYKGPYSDIALNPAGYLLSVRIEFTLTVQLAAT